MRKHLIIATYDGIGTHYSGVGTIAKNLIDALSSLTDFIPIKVSIAYVNVDKTSRVFNQSCFDAAKNVVVKTGGRLIPLCNSSKGESEWDMWRGFDEWNFTCVSLVSTLNLTLDDDEENIILLNDTPFLFFAKYKHLVNSNLKCLYFPLSTGKNHDFGNEQWRTSRIRSEQEFFDLIKADENSRVVSLGKTFARKMNEDYGLHFGQHDYLQNGLNFENYAGFLSSRFSNDALEKFGISLKDNARIIFAWGRCSVAKGFLELANAWAACCEQLPNHYLIIQMPNNSGEDDYFLSVSTVLKSASRAITIDDFNPRIWKTILRNENTDVVCIPSLMDPFPHTAIEAKLFSRGMNYITLISDVDGAVDGFTEAESIYVDPRDTEQFALHSVVLRLWKVVRAVTSLIRMKVLSMILISRKFLNRL